MERIFTISEVSNFTDINESTLRNWEREFSDYLVVSRDEQGARFYTQKDIERFKMIQNLRKKGLSIGAIKDLLSSFQNGENSINSTVLQMATTTEVIHRNNDFIELEVLQMIENLPERIRKLVQQELKDSLSEHREQVTSQIGDIVESRLEKYRKKRAWWKFW